MAVSSWDWAKHLLEERFMDAQTGRMLNANLEDYKVPGTFEIPEIKSICF